jgi:hypothetical protein
MKLSAIPIAVGLITYLSILSIITNKQQAQAYLVRWSWGPYIIIFVIVLAVIKGIHFKYYNSKKNVAKNAA